MWVTVIKDGEIKRVVRLSPDMAKDHAGEGETIIVGVYPRDKYELDRSGNPVPLAIDDPKRAQRAVPKPPDPVKMVRALRRDLKALGFETATFDRLMRGE